MGRRPKINAMRKVAGAQGWSAQNGWTASEARYQIGPKENGPVMHRRAG